MNDDIWASTQSRSYQDSRLAPGRSPLLDAKVMMVDDEPLMTDLIQTYLEDEGYGNFVATNDPRLAIDMLRREQPSVLLLDLMMPGLSGFDLLEMIRADRELRYTSVIVLTASTGADAKLRALQLGVTDFLSKPVDASELVLRLRNTLAFQQYHDRLINYDLVTGLPTERVFDKGIDEMLARRSLVGGVVAQLSIVVPECRQLRETVDQAAADELTKSIARRLERFANATTIVSVLASSAERAPRVARLGTDQFGLLLEGQDSAEAVEGAAQQLLVLLAEPVSVGPHQVVVGASIGIAMAPTDGDSAKALRKGADLAVTHARESGSANFKFCSPELNARSYEKMTLGLQLRGAAERGELRLHYQPKVDLRSGQIIGAEALVRWKHPEHGLMAPGRFIGLAEELGLICDIGQWVIDRACQDAAGWLRAGHAPLKIAVNVAKPQFVAGNLCDVIRRAVFDSGLPPQQLVIELTESMLMEEVESGLALMHDLKALGVTLSIDDFGTGYSSLSYLTRFPLDELKIDRSFVMHVPERTSEVAVVRTVIDLGHRLGMTVIAEGVETTEQLNCLKQLDCDHFQGFLFSRPLPEDHFVDLLARHRAERVSQS